MAYATVDELRGWVGIPAGDTADDSLLTLALDTAASEIDAYCGRSFPDDTYLTVPAAVKYANMLQAARLWQRRHAPFGVAGSVELGSEVRLLDELDRDVQRALKRYRKQWWVV